MKEKNQKGEGGIIMLFLITMLIIFGGGYLVYNSSYKNFEEKCNNLADGRNYMIQDMDGFRCFIDGKLYEM